MEVAITNAYILYVGICKKNKSKPINHIMFRQQMAMALIGDVCQGGGASTSGWHSISDKDLHL
jgi:hypothetical protein